MKSHMRFILLALVLFQSVALCQVPADELTGTLPNGRYWQSLKPSERITYLYGMEGEMVLLGGVVGQQLGKEIAGQIEKIADNLSKGEGFDFGNLRQQVNTFYEDSLNIRLPIPIAYRYCLMKMRGVNPSDLERIKASLRHYWDQF